MSRYAFTNAENIVVNVIVGDLMPNEKVIFLRHQTDLLGATEIIDVQPDQSVWIGGAYDSGTGEFLPPAPTTSEPEPPVVEPEIDPEIAAIVGRLEVIEADLGITTVGPE